MASTADIKNGIVLNIDGALWTIIEFQHVKPGKGGAFVRTKMKNLMTGKVVDKTYNAGTKIDITNVDRRDFQYLYNDGNEYVFMDKTNYEQLAVSEVVVGDAKIVRPQLEKLGLPVELMSGSDGKSASAK